MFQNKKSCLNNPLVTCKDMRSHKPYVNISQRRKVAANRMTMSANFNLNQTIMTFWQICFQAEERKFSREGKKLSNRKLNELYINNLEEIKMSDSGCEIDDDWGLSMTHSHTKDL